jgi:hypothetical protein
MLRCCTLLIALFVAVQFHSQNRAGGIKLEDRLPEYSDDLIVGHGDVEKDIAEFDAAKVRLEQ